MDTFDYFYGVVILQLLLDRAGAVISLGFSKKKKYIASQGREMAELTRVT